MMNRKLVFSPCFVESHFNRNLKVCCGQWSSRLVEPLHCEGRGAVCPTPWIPGGSTIPSTLKLRTMLEAGVDDLSVVYLLYKSIMYWGGSALVLSWEGMPLRLRLRRKSTFMFSRNIFRSKTPSSPPPDHPSELRAFPSGDAWPQLCRGFCCVGPTSRKSGSRAARKAPGDILGPDGALRGCCGVSLGAMRSPGGKGPHCPVDRLAGSLAGSRSPQHSDNPPLFLSGCGCCARTSYLRQLSLMKTV